jgi:hypothetical protein
MLAMGSFIEKEDARWFRKRHQTNRLRRKWALDRGMVTLAKIRVTARGEEGEASDEPLASALDDPFRLGASLARPGML